MTSILSELYSSRVLRVLVFFLICLWLNWIWKRRKLYLLAYRIPGPVSLPIVGNVIQLGLINDHGGVFKRIMDMKKKYGEIFSFWLGPELAIVLSEPKDFEDIMTSKSTHYKGKAYDIVKTAIDEGLLTASGNLWKKHRHVINPSFALKVIRGYQKNYDTHARHLVKSMYTICDKGNVEFSTFIRRYFGDVICQNLFELNMDFYKGTFDHVINVTVVGAAITFERVCKIWLIPDIIFKNCALGRKFEKLMDKYRTTIHTRLKEKIDEIIKRKSKSERNMMNAASNTDVDDLNNADYSVDQLNKSSLAVMVDAMLKGNFTVEEILHEFDNIYNPGIDTSYTQMSSFVLCIGMYKEWQDKIWKEIKELYKDNMDDDVVTSHFSQLPCLDMVLKEVMRYFATGTFTIRYVQEDFYLKNRDVMVPTGASLFMCPLLLHKNPKYWKDPEVFDPNRFLPEEVAKRPPYSYVPFSSGLRDCIGQIFAQDSMKTAAIHLIRNFEFESDMILQELPMQTDISMRSAIGYHVKIKRRDRNL